MIVLGIDAVRQHLLKFYHFSQWFICALLLLSYSKP